MSKPSELDEYTAYLCEALGHADRHTGLTDYCRGLMLPIERKSVEPLAANISPYHVCAKHQSLHHFVAKSDWSDEAVLMRVRDWVLPGMVAEKGLYWIVDDTGFPKKGRHSVGVARQYCGQLGKQDNCQVAVSLSVASEAGSVPVEYGLYLPEIWAEDLKRRIEAGVPENLRFATKPQISMEQICRAKESGLPPGPVLADAGYGTDTSFRSGLTEIGLKYCVGVQPTVSVWEPGKGPLPPKARGRKGPVPKRLRREPGHKPVSVKMLAQGFAEKAWKRISWREGSNGKMISRFAAVRVRPAHRDEKLHQPRAEEWLLVEWPKGEAEPAKYWLSTLPDDTHLKDLVRTAKMRWRIERDYQELKQEFGLGHYEGRGWRGFHHHATLSIAAYGFLTGQRLREGSVKKNAIRSKVPSLPKGYMPRGAGAHTAACRRFHRNPAVSDCTQACEMAAPVSLLRTESGAFMTQ